MPPGVSLGVDTTVTGTLTFNSGIVTTGAHSLYLASGGTVSRTSGHVAGNFKKYIATGATSKTFEVGDSSIYAPVAVAFASVTVAGDLTVSTTAGDHSAIATSTLDPSQDANRFWTLTNNGITFTTYDATFTFVGETSTRGRITSTSSSRRTPAAPGPRSQPGHGPPPARRQPRSTASATSPSGS